MLACEVLVDIRFRVEVHQERLVLWIRQFHQVRSPPHPPTAACRTSTPSYRSVSPSDIGRSSCRKPTIVCPRSVLIDPERLFGSESTVRPEPSNTEAFSRTSNAFVAQREPPILLSNLIAPSRRLFLPQRRLRLPRNRPLRIRRRHRIGIHRQRARRTLLHHRALARRGLWRRVVIGWRLCGSPHGLRRLWLRLS